MQSQNTKKKKKGMNLPNKITTFRMIMGLLDKIDGQKKLQMQTVAETEAVSAKASNFISSKLEASTLYL